MASATKKKQFTLGKTHNYFFPHAVRKNGVDIAHCATKQDAHQIRTLLEKTSAKKKG